MSANRLEKINEEVKKELSQIISFELKDPRITGIVSVTKVSVTQDLKYAKVYISTINSKDKLEVIKGLKSASGHLRSQIGHRINLRYTPELIFELDDSIEYGAHIQDVLNDIMKDIKPEDSEE